MFYRVAPCRAQSSASQELQSMTLYFKGILQLMQGYAHNFKMIELLIQETGVKFIVEWVYPFIGSYLLPKPQPLISNLT